MGFFSSFASRCFLDLEPSSSEVRDISSSIVRICCLVNFSFSRRFFCFRGFLCRLQKTVTGACVLAVLTLELFGTPSLLAMAFLCLSLRYRLELPRFVFLSMVLVAGGCFEHDFVASDDAGGPHSKNGPRISCSCSLVSQFFFRLPPSDAAHSCSVIFSSQNCQMSVTPSVLYSAG